MRIKLDEKHYLNSDPYCYWISCEVKSENAKKKVYDKRVSGYYTTLEGAVHSYINRQIMSSEVKSRKERVEEVSNLKKTVNGWKVALKRGERTNEQTV